MENKENKPLLDISYIILAIILLSVMVFLYKLHLKECNVLSQIREELKTRTYPSVVFSKNVADTMDVKLFTKQYANYKEDINKDILLEINKEAKYYNEVLYEKQTTTLQVVIYVIAFISLIAAFFGYKTIKDIKDNANDEAKKLSRIYENTFELLNKQATLTNEFYGVTYKHFTEEIERAKQDIEEIDQKKNEIENEIKELKNLDRFSEEFFNKKDKKNQDSKQKASEKVVKISEEAFNEEVKK